MNHRDRELIILGRAFACGSGEVERLHAVVRYVETDEAFCAAHQLVTRMGITSKRKKLLEAIRHQQLKPFQFLINNN